MSSDGRPTAVTLVVVFFGLAALLHGANAVRFWKWASSGSENGKVFALLASISLACSVAAMIGLLKGRAWGWWCGVLVAAISLLLHGKFTVSLLTALNWDHPNVGQGLLLIVLLNGLPFVIHAFLGVLLALPAVRLFAGVKDRPIQRRRRVVRARG